MSRAKRPNTPEHDVSVVRRFAVATIELDFSNTRVLKTHINLARPLRVAAVIGTTPEGKRGVLIEIGVRGGVPWGGTCGWKIQPRTRRGLFHLRPLVRNELLRVLGAIAERRMNGWKTNGTFTKRVTKHVRGRARWHSYEFLRGIHFSFLQSDPELIEFLRWHEIYHSSSLRLYLANRIDRVLWALSRPRSTERTKKRQLTRQAERLLGIFTRSQTLQDPYVLTELSRMVGESQGAATRAELLNFLSTEGIADLDMIYLIERTRPKPSAVPHLDIEIRLARKRANGTLTYRIHRKHSDDCPF